MKRKKEARLKIGGLARAAGVNLQTIYYYERRGILAPAVRLDSGYRLFDDGAVRKLRFIKNAQRLGFTLSEIAALLNLRVGRTDRCEPVLIKAETKLRQVEEKMKSLAGMGRSLRRLIADCRSKKTTDACPILECLETEDACRQKSSKRKEGFK